MEPILAALIGLGFPGIVIALQTLAITFLGKEHLLLHKEHTQMVKDLSELHIADLKEVLVQSQRLNESQTAALDRLTAKIG